MMGSAFTPDVRDAIPLPSEHADRNEGRSGEPIMPRKPTEKQILVKEGLL